MVSRGSGRFDTNKALRELHSESDRAVALVGGAVVEQCLHDALLVHLHKDKRLTDRLFHPSSALGSFAIKIDLGYLVGLYGDGARSELNLIRKIRNEFAHNLEVQTFAAEPVSSWVNGLKFGERYVGDIMLSPFNVDQSRPFGEWSSWTRIADAKNTLATPRGRFVLSMSALTVAFTVADKTAMPTPVW